MNLSLTLSRSVLFAAWFTFFLGLSLIVLAKVLPGLRAEASPLALTAVSSVEFDFDGDGKADIGRWQISSNKFKVRYADDGAYDEYSVGSYGAKVAPGDFNGGGQTDFAVFDGAAGTWTYKISPTGTPQTISLGAAGDIPVAADYDGDNITDAAVYRPSTSVWYIRKSSTSTTISQTWGTSGDIPVVGDYDDDGKSDLAVWRPSSGYWYIVQSSTSTSFSNQWGEGATDIPIPGDYNGDGQTEIAVFRRTTGVWYIKTSPGYTSWTTQSWGNLGDQPVPADYDGDGIDDFAVWRPTTGVWYLVYSGDNYSINTFTLGEAVDRAVPAAYLKQVGGAVLPDELAASRLSPRNATGGTDLYSQNFAWGRNLVSLPGRAGMDLSLGIAYNSLVWTKSGEDLYYDVDRGNAGPGFRLGFPVIEPVYYDGAKAKFAYMMIAPSGARVEFRQTTVSNIYETADSSYAQLKTINASNPNDPVDPITITVTTTDGSQLMFDWKPGVDRFVCERITDRNGNYITIGYDTDGLLNSVTDTLGRVITVTNTDGYPTSITQNWKTDNGAGSTNDPKTWASFTYGTKSIDTNYFGPSVIGPPDGYSLKVLEKITYLDGSFTKFTYNGYGQVYMVKQHAPDSGTTEHVLNSTTLDLSAPTISTDVPRFKSTDNYAENFNGGTPVTVENSDPVAVTSYALVGGGITIDSSMVKVGVAGHPNQLYTRIHFGPSGWKEGLTIATEDCIGSVSDTSCTGTARKRWTWNDFEQDNTSLAYPLNPRVKESQVGDGTNTKKTTIAYYEPTTGSFPYGLPETITVGDLSTVLKTQTLTYNLSSDYTSRRIIGLPSETKHWEGTSSGTLMSKVTYGYDEGGYTGTGQSLSNATQHCTSTSGVCPTAYGTSFPHRGNQTSVKRWDVTAPTSGEAAVQSTIVYNIAGSPISKTTPWDGTNTRTVSIGYADTWNDSVSRTTYAYPTSVTDPNSQTSPVKYRFDIGANVEATTPAPAGQTHGKTTKRLYDTYGRLEKDSVYVNTTEQSYTRYAYPDNNGNQLQVYSTLVDVTGSTAGLDPGDEAMTETFFDGAGRRLRTRTPHPGSTGEWSATKTEYDILGRVIGQSVPTEVSVSGSTWTPAGNDSSGYKWTYQKYDWMGRVVRKINTDGNPAASENDSDVFINYSTCGCAGGLETTIEGEKVPRTDTTGTARRKQKMYQDILGRTFKTETFDWAGNVYLRTEHDFNGRNQITQTDQTDLAADPDVTQTATATFDGHGRLASSHRPEQRDGSTLKYTTYSYNQDDSIQTVTDARGAVTTYTYENAGGVPKRPLVTGISWTVPGGSGITDPTDVAYTYDNLGNRTAMTDGLGLVAYAYDSLSRLTSETRTFSDSLADKPMGNFNLSYEYTLGGILKSYTDPYGQKIEYAHDKTGRMNSISGSTFGGVTSYANNPTYRAWGGLKHLEYGSSGWQANATFNDRLQVSAYTVNEMTNTSNKKFDRSYQYYPDAALKLADEESSSGDEKFDRLMIYDHQGRVSAAKSGIEAHGNSETDLTQLPYRQTYTYDAFDHISHRESTLWNYPSGDWDFQVEFENNRSANYAYDADGRIVTDWNYESEDFNPAYFKYDASGGLEKTWRYVSAYETIINRDGLGSEAKRTQRSYDRITNQWGAWNTVYLIRSSILGTVVSEAGNTGSKTFTYVLGLGAVIARQGGSGSYASVAWKLTDAAGLSTRNYSTSANSASFKAEEFDALGNNVGTSLYIAPPDHSENETSPHNSRGITYPAEQQCTVQGVYGPCAMLHQVYDDAGFGEWGNFGTFFSRQDSQSRYGALPFPVRGRSEGAGSVANNPMYIAHEIVNSFNTGSGGTQINWNTGRQELSPTQPLFSYNEILLANLIGDGGRAAKPSSEQIKNAIGGCMNKFWGTNKRSFRVSGMSFAVSGVLDGYFEIETATAQGGWKPMPRALSTSTITSDAKTYTGSQLAEMNRRDRPKDKRDYLIGYTPSGSTSKTYLANDLESHKTWSMESSLDETMWVDFAGQVHELGLALAAKYGGIDPPERYDDNDSGMAFEDCVAGNLRSRR